ncbi:UPF0481 protein At3g47200-like [Cornus florida]|uniref:UPF0481 protein At3g47200-like n=1 Tax=Cornus florida TaxID=4283 RepID=UPI0028A2CC62|nr:UPF0481 protein At3g47200-like [Cornus florida]
MQQDEEFVNKLILNFCSNDRIQRMGKCLHVLDVYRKSLLRGEDPRKSYKPRVTLSGGGIIWSASELNEAGIRFKRSGSVSLKDISFHGGVLSLPRIVVDDVTEPLFLNLIAFKRYHVGTGNEVTSYIFFMNSLIKTVGDITSSNSWNIVPTPSQIETKKPISLRQSPLALTIMARNINLEPTEEHKHRYIFLMINPIENVSQSYVSNYYLSNQCKMQWNLWRANLLNTYFRSPCSILAVIPAIFLSALTMAQTVYTALSY